MSVCDDVDMSITNLSAVCKIITCFYKVNRVLIIIIIKKWGCACIDSFCLKRSMLYFVAISCKAHTAAIYALGTEQDIQLQPHRLSCFYQCLHGPIK